MIATLTDIEAHLSQFIERVQSGETIWVKSEDRLVARIEPVSVDKSDDKDDERWVEELIARGIAKRPAVQPTKDELAEELEELFSDPIKPREGVDVMAVFLKEREEGR